MCDNEPHEMIQVASSGSLDMDTVSHVPTEWNSCITVSEIITMGTVLFNAQKSCLFQAPLSCKATIRKIS